MSCELLRREMIIVVLFGELEIAETRCDAADLVVDSLMLELVEAVELQ